jgi:serine phosphatase RsbU (regulator of sigma subunit)
MVDWGGDPTNKLLAAREGENVRLSPRKSFEKWRQLVRGRSAAWQPWETAAADELGKHIIGLLFARSREQVAVAESLQRSVVLDHAPHFTGLQVAANYRPATTYQLGGDWWDAFELDDGRVAIVVGDTAGHGVAAVSAMTQMRTALRAYLLEGHSPGACLDKLDHLSATLFAHVATAVVAIADPAAHTLHLANAGHPQPLIVSGDDAGSARDAEVPVRPLLGVGFGEATTFSVTMPPGTAMLFYTDGLIERRGTDLAEQAHRFRDHAARTFGTDIEAWLRGLMAFSDAQAGDDDTTLLAVRFE